MPKLLIKATELVDTNVNFVSLVKRGANRIPFRIMKEDDTMLDLHKIGRSLFKKAEVKPEIVAAIIAKAEDVETVAKIFKEAGLDPEKFVKSVKDGVTTVAKSDIDKAKDALVMKLTDTVALVVSGIKKAFVDYELGSTSFAEVNATGGYCMSLSMAGDLMRQTVGNILYAATTPDEAAEGIQKACDEFKKYVVTLTKGLPAQAFKADVAFAKALVEVNVTPGDEPVLVAAAAEGPKVEAVVQETQKAEPPVEEQDKKTPVAEDEEVEKAAYKKAEPEEPAADEKVEAEAGGAAADDKADEPAAPAEETQKNEGDADVGKTGRGKKKPEFQSGAGEQAAPEQDLTDATKSDDLLRVLAALQKTLDEGLAAVRSDVNALNTRVDDVTAQVKKTDAALNGTVFAEADDDAAAKLRKSNFKSAPPLLDTAYHRHRAA